MPLDELQVATPIEMLANLAEAPVEVCLAEGARWTLRRVHARGLAIMTMIAVRRLSGSGLAYAKGLVVDATLERVTALGEAVDRRDPDATLAILEAWYGFSMERDASARLAVALIDEFGVSR